MAVKASIDSPNLDRDNSDGFQSITETEDVKLEVLATLDTPEVPMGRKRSSVRTADNIFDKIFHSPPSNYLALKLYGRIIPGNPHKQKLQPGDSKWMIHPYSHFK